MNCIKRIVLAVCVALLALAAFPAAADAQSIIKQPGNHPDYSFELEPHFVFQWGGRYGADDGFGPGVRFSIPFTRNGPIPSINNNMGITFGLDITFGGDYCYYNRAPGFPYAGCNGSLTEFWLPVAMQWNFFLTRVISVFGEPGFAIVHHRWSYDDPCLQPYCGHSSHTGFDGVFEAGGRFLFSDRIGAIVRIGYPMFSGGLNILF